MEAVVDPALESLPETIQRVEVHIVSDLSPCDFWLGVYQTKGDNQLLTLFDDGNWQHAMDLAAEEGLAEKEDVFFAATHKDLAPP